MKVLVCGSRTWHRDDIIKARLAQLPRGTHVIHGGARGADQMAATIATALGFTVDVFWPDWVRDGVRAGIERNKVMLDQQPDLVLAFWKGGSTGTGHTVSEAGKRGIKVEVVTEAQR
jgi:hypothetical protein